MTDVFDIVAPKVIILDPTLILSGTGATEGGSFFLSSDTTKLRMTPFSGSGAHTITSA